MEHRDKILIAGHTGLIGSALLDELKSNGFAHCVTPTRHDLDLCRQSDVQMFFKKEQIDFVFMLAARVGGIHANETAMADFLYDNAMMTLNVLHAAAQHSVRKLLFVASSCAFPVTAPQPYEENAILSGPFEETNEGFGIAKVMGIKLCDYYRKQYGKNFISAIPASVYGPGDRFDSHQGHVIASLMKRMSEAKQRGAKEFIVWGSGKPIRECIHSRDVARALVVLMNRYDQVGPINIGSGEEVSIRQLAEKIRTIVGFEGELRFDVSKKDGAPRKCVKSDRIRKLGWSPSITLDQGLLETYQWAQRNGRLVSEGHFSPKEKQASL